jgi:hypothetical protein
MRREILVAWHFAAAASALSACQGSGGMMAAGGNEPRGTPPSDFCAAQEPTRILRADPSNYRSMIGGLVPGDTLVLTAGEYPRLTIANLAGAPSRCITITGPAGDRPAVIFGEIGNKTVEIIDSSYIVVRNLVIDGRGLPGADGIKALASPHPATHHVVLDGNLIIGAGANQQTDGITTKIPTWNWIIRRNTILSAGTALYLGDSDGTAPFIAGLIETIWSWTRSAMACRSSIRSRVRSSLACRNEHKPLSSEITCSRRACARHLTAIGQTCWWGAFPKRARLERSLSDLRQSADRQPPRSAFPGLRPHQFP